MKYKSSFELSPQKEEVTLALQLANKTKERSSVLAQIERERVLVSDLKAKYEKHTETLTQLMERKYSLQREIEELESLSAAAEAKQQSVPVEPLAPGAPQPPQPVGPRDVFPGPPPLIEEVHQDEEGDDKAIMPTKHKLAKATAVGRVLGKGVFSRGRRSSLIVKASSLSTQDLVLLQEKVTELSNSRQIEDKNEVQDVAEQGSDISATELEPSASLGWRFSRRRLRKRRHFFELWLLCRSQVSRRQSSSSFPCFVLLRAFLHAWFFLATRFLITLREKSNVSLGCVASSTVPGLFDSGCPPLVERVRLAASELEISAIAGREDGASGTPVA